MQVLNDYQNFKTFSAIKWLGDYKLCALLQMPKKVLKNDQAWLNLNELKPQQGWFTLASSVVVFDSYDAFQKLNKDQPILNGECVSSNGSTSWHLRPDISGELALYELSEQSGETHLVKTQEVFLKSQLVQTGKAQYRLYSMQDNTANIQQIASRFVGFTDLKVGR